MVEKIFSAVWTNRVVLCNKQERHPLDSRVHGQLKPLLTIDFDCPIVILIQGFEGTAHGIQPHKAANVIVKIHVPIFITVSANYHLEQLVIEGEASSCESFGSSSALMTPELSAS